MKIVVFSFTGNCKKFLERCAVNEENIIELKEDLVVLEDYILVTPTIGFGEVPVTVKNFLENNENKPRGVLASGNRNWGTNFANAADVINKDYNVPILMKFELNGTTSEVEKFKKIYVEME